MRLIAALVLFLFAGRSRCGAVVGQAEGNEARANHVLPWTRHRRDGARPAVHGHAHPRHALGGQGRPPVARRRGRLYRAAGVGAFKPNGFGLHDMLGNLSEWVKDCYNKSYEGAPTDGRAWTTADCPRRVLRGGNWSDSPVGVRSANRNGDPLSLHNLIVGFRVARTLP